MTYRNWPAFLLIFAALALSSGCVYRANIAQGNLIKEEDLAQLEMA